MGHTSAKHSRGRKFTRLSEGDDSWLAVGTSRSGRAETSREKRSWQSCSDLTLKVEVLDGWPMEGLQLAFHAQIWLISLLF